MAITLIFFYWPASQAIWQSFLLEDAFGLSSEFVGFENYVHLFQQPEYYRAMVTTAIFSHRGRLPLARLRAAAGDAGRQEPARSGRPSRPC